MVQIAVFEIFRILLLHLDLWFKLAQLLLCTNPADDNGKPTELIFLKSTDYLLKTQNIKMSPRDVIAYITWEELYKQECRSFKASLEIQAEILRKETILPLT